MAINGKERENPRKGIYFCVFSGDDGTSDAPDDPDRVIFCVL